MWLRVWVSLCVSATKWTKAAWVCHRPQRAVPVLPLPSHVLCLPWCSRLSPVGGVPVRVASPESPPRVACARLGRLLVLVMSPVARCGSTRPERHRLRCSAGAVRNVGRESPRAGGTTAGGRRNRRTTEQNRGHRSEPRDVVPNPTASASERSRSMRQQETTQELQRKSRATGWKLEA